MTRIEVRKKKQCLRNLTAKTILSVDEWLALFEESEYSGDYFGLCHKHVSAKVRPRKVEISLFETILRIRMVEERIATEYEKQEMRCPVTSV